MPDEKPSPTRHRRERSARYPGASLAEAIELCRLIETRGVDGLGAAEVAAALGFKNVKTNTFSARLSAARQFGLIGRDGAGSGLTPLARAILHPVDPAELPRLYRRALLESPLYADLAAKLAGKVAPDGSILANHLYHNYQITAAAKQAAAEAFLESARFAGVLDADGLIRPDGPPTAPEPAADKQSGSPTPPRGAAVRIDLRLWGPDHGKTIRVRAPETITRASFERLLQALRLHLRIEEPLDGAET
jgi:hypothetical protein